MTDQEIIQKLGGVKAISEYFGFKYNTVHNWLTRGIPSQVKVDYPKQFMSKNPRPLKVKSKNSA